MSHSPNMRSEWNQGRKFEPSNYALLKIQDNLSKLCLDLGIDESDQATDRVSWQAIEDVDIEETKAYREEVKSPRIMQGQ